MLGNEWLWLAVKLDVRWTQRREPTLQDRVAGECTDRDTWQERGEEEEIAGADDGHIVFGRIKVFEKRS